MILISKYNVPKVLSSEVTSLLTDTGSTTFTDFLASFMTYYTDLIDINTVYSDGDMAYTLGNTVSSSWENMSADGGLLGMNKELNTNVASPSMAYHDHDNSHTHILDNLTLKTSHTHTRGLMYGVRNNTTYSTGVAQYDIYGGTTTISTSKTGFSCRLSLNYTGTTITDDQTLLTNVNNYSIIGDTDHNYTAPSKLGAKIIKRNSMIVVPHYLPNKNFNFWYKNTLTESTTIKDSYNLFRLSDMYLLDSFSTLSGCSFNSTTNSKQFYFSGSNNYMCVNLHGIITPNTSCIAEFSIVTVQLGITLATVKLAGTSDDDGYIELFGEVNDRAIQGLCYIGYISPTIYLGDGLFSIHEDGYGLQVTVANKVLIETGA